ncbi:hypothetical protein JXA63_02080 [Candidatus Woesebacteria bacterium]|nr:hypothetical protein [Candidatus Woesebacteria bacterium]
MKRTILQLGTVLFTSLLVVCLFVTSGVSAESTEEKLQRLQVEIGQYQEEIERLNSQANTLSNQIAQYDAQIRLTTLRISETEEKILLLGGRIDQLEQSLNSLNNAFTSRVTQTYKMARLNDPFVFLLLSEDIDKAVSSYHYLKKIQEADRDLLIRLEKAQINYQVEKEDQEDLQDELKDQKASLDAQKAAKANLLEVTRNDEKRYQDLLAAARSEFEAIQAILAGQGDEEEVGHVNAGEKIATIIQGASCNSSGTHLHFMVSSDNTSRNPFEYLRSGIDFEDCSGSSCGSGDGDNFNPTGSWDWPISPKIKYTQGYGSTWAIRNTWVGRIYGFHNGIDINSEFNPDIKAVKSGTLYRGSYGGSGGCRLRYVRVDHDDSDLDTLYLHINY